MSTSERRRVADLPLVWKLLLPSIVLTLVLGVVGTFAVVRYFSQEAQADVDNQLTRAAVGVEVSVADETDYLLESARVSSNVEGMDAAVVGRRLDDLTALLSGSAAIRNRADLFVVTDATGTGLVELRRTGEEISAGAGTAWAAAEVVNRVLPGHVEGVRDETSGIVRDGAHDFLVIAAAVLDGETPVGAAIVGTRLENLAARVTSRVGAPVAFYGEDGSLLAATEPGFSRRATAPPGDRTRRENDRIDGRAVSTLFAPLEVRGTPSGVLAVTLPRDTALGSLGGAAARVGGAALIAMIAILAVGVVIARLLLRRVRELVTAHRELASGNLETRVRVSGRDELGELARGFNDMAEQLQAGYRELERRVAERTDELQYLYDESVRAAEGRAEFFAAISHDLRTPLFVISGHAELMVHPEMHPDEQGWEQDFGKAIHRSAQELLGRVNDILELAKLDTAQPTLELADVSLAEQTGLVLAELAPLAQQGQLRLLADVPADLPLVRADRARSRDILRNLIANAIKYTPAGGEVRIEATAARRGMATVSVTDTGVGIPQEAHAHLFTPFYQVPGIRPQGGQSSSGLGLAVAHRLVAAHGGAMTVESEVGVGSTFTFTVPVAPTRRPPRASGTTPGRRRGVAAKERATGAV